MFVCTAISAVHVEFMDMYTTDSFLMAMRRFMCLRGTPMRIQSHRGEQLVAARSNSTCGTKDGTRIPVIPKVIFQSNAQDMGDMAQGSEKRGEGPDRNIAQGKGRRR